LINALTEVLDELPRCEGPVILSGMIGSSVGLQTVPYVHVPAGPGDIERAMVRLNEGSLPSHLSAREVWIVPGLEVHEGDRWDVMRGEETEFFGQDVTDGVLVAPGSHSKWIVARDGNITRFRTMMTGEVFAAVAAHTLLKSSVLASLEVHESEAPEFRAGVLAAQADGLLSNLFAVRTRSLAGASPAAATAFLSGLVIGAELHDGLQWAGNPETVRIISDGALLTWYKTALNTIGVEASPATESAAALGAWRIARSIPEKGRSR